MKAIEYPMQLKTIERMAWCRKESTQDYLRSEHLKNAIRYNVSHDNSELIVVDIIDANIGNPDVTFTLIVKPVNPNPFEDFYDEHQ